ncbi:MAG: Holliday junction resolvase RuvX [Planctomycetota bacterium]
METKWLGIDYGSKRVGLAISGALGFVHILPTFHRTKNLAEDLQRLKKLMQQEAIQEIVIGFPKNMNNSVGFKAEEVLQFVEHLKQTIPFPVHLWDERLTTQQAQLMIQHLPEKNKKALVDSIAAKLILESFLDAQKNRKSQDIILQNE